MTDQLHLQVALKKMLPSLDEKTTDFINHRLEQLLADSVIKQRSVNKGELIYTYGRTCQRFSLILEGVIRCYSYVGRNDDRQEVNLRFLSALSILLPFGSFCQTVTHLEPLALNRTRESAEAVTDCLLLDLPISLLTGEDSNIVCSKVSHNPTALFPAALRYRLQAEIAARHYLSMEQRLRMMLRKNASERYQYFRHVMSETIVAHMPDYHVASYLGMTPETLSRIKKSLP